MSIDRETLREFLEHLADRFTACELVEILEDMELITVYDILGAFEEQLIEAKERLEQ